MNEIITPFLIVIILGYGFLCICSAETVKKSVDEIRDDNGETEESKDESMDLPVENETNNITCTRRQNSLMHEILSASYKQFPFMVAIMSQQNEYLCSGSVISNGLILTTAKCTQKPVSYVLLNTTKAKKDDSSVMVHVRKSDRFPSFTGSESLKDIGLIYTEKYNSSVVSKIKLSNFTSASEIIDLNALGFGLNSDVAQTRELQYVGVEHRSIETGDLLKGYFDCIDTKVLTCFKDTGGPVIFNNELIGVITKGQEDCTKEMTSIYAVNKLMVEALPTYTFKAWLDEKIQKNEEQDETSLITYPMKPVLRQRIHKMTSASDNFIIFPLTIFITFLVHTIL
ncbi:LOW QUALITY PROTEIN: uncharacterized protein ACR2FA_012214 [Aphomia sociella]